MVRHGDVAAEVTRAAVELFAAQGYATTSVQQIVEAAGVTKGAMYHWFSSKDDLLFGIYDRLLALQQSRLDEIAARDLPIAELVREVCIDVVETSLAHLAEGTVFLQSAHLLSAPRRAEVTVRRRAYHDAFGALLERGVAAGVFRSDMPLAVLIAHFFSDVHYLGQWYSPAGRDSAARVAAELTELYLGGIRAPA